ARLLEVLIVDRLAGREVDVDAGQVHELERPHAEATHVAHDAVDILRLCDALAQDADALGEAAAAVIDDEARRVAAAHGDAALALADDHQRLSHPGCGEHAVDHLDQLHQRYRIEIVQAGDARLVLADGRDLRDRQRGGVGGEDRVGAADGVEGREQVLLDLEILEHRFDDDLAIAERFDAVDDLDAPQRRFGGVGGHPALLDLAPQHAVDEVLRLLGGSRIGVEYLAAHSALGRDLNDAASHHAGADDADAEIGAVGVEGHGSNP